MGCDDFRDVAAIENTGPEQSLGAVDGCEEQAEEQEERRHFGEKQFPQRQRKWQQNLIIAAIEEQRVPFEYDNETHHDH